MTSEMDNQAFQALTGIVVKVNQGISTDKGEWDRFAAICADASNKGLRTYIERASMELWTDDEDQGSWTIVKQAAEHAKTYASDNDALVSILGAFGGITAPSHNSAQWGAVWNVAHTNLERLLQNEPFGRLMYTVVKLDRGISTDAGEWHEFAAICKSAMTPENGIRSYIQQASTKLWTDGLDQGSWTIVKNAAKAAESAPDDQNAFKTILRGFMSIFHPSHNEGQWGTIKNLAAKFLYTNGAEIKFSGVDTRPRRLIPHPNLVPEAMSSSFLIKRGGLPARYTETFGQKTCHVEYIMRLDLTDAEGSAFFIVTHSQDLGGYVALCKIPGANVGKGASDHEIVTVEPNFAGEVVWWDHLNHDHPGGCNHPGNGGQIGDITVLVGQDWTKTYPFIGHPVDPVRKGSVVLFYNFSMLENGGMPSWTDGSNATDAYMGCLTTVQLGLRPGHDGEVQSVNIEQGPDGYFYLVAGNPGQTVIWKSRELLPDISKWTQVQFGGPDQMNDGSSMLAWSTFAGREQLYYVTAAGHGMSFRPLKYDVENDGDVRGIWLDGATLITHQDDRFGDGDWVADNGSVYAGASHEVAYYGAYKSINDSKGPAGQEHVPCIQVRAWYQKPGR